MRHKNKLLSLLIICCFSFAATASAGLVPCNGPSCTLCDLLVLVKNIINFMVAGVMAPLAGLAFLIGGIMMVAAAGSEERYKKGKQIFANTLIGVLIVLGSWVVINTLITTLGSNVDGFVADNWWNVRCR